VKAGKLSDGDERFSCKGGCGVSIFSARFCRWVGRRRGQRLMEMAVKTQARKAALRESEGEKRAIAPGG